MSFLEHLDQLLQHDINKMAPTMVLKSRITFPYLTYSFPVNFLCWCSVALQGQVFSLQSFIITLRLPYSALCLYTIADKEHKLPLKGEFKVALISYMKICNSFRKLRRTQKKSPYHDVRTCLGDDY